MAAQNYTTIAATAEQRRSTALSKQYSLSPEILSSLGTDLSVVSTDERVYTEAEITIINSDADAILAHISSQTWSALEVTHAFCKAAAVAQQLV